MAPTADYLGRDNGPDSRKGVSRGEAPARFAHRQRFNQAPAPKAQPPKTFNRASYLSFAGGSLSAFGLVCSSISPDDPQVR